MTQDEEDAVILHNCLLRFMALSNMYSSTTISLVIGRIQKLYEDNNFYHEELFLEAAEKYLYEENKR